MKKKILIFLLFILSASIFSEVVKVPQYNYWIYPPVGWVLQDYKNDSDLSWFSPQRDVAFTIKSFKGDTYSSVEEMARDLTSNIEGEGDFVPFTYEGRDSLIGDILFLYNGSKHRGWFILINGEDVDYYFYAYAFEEDYSGATPRILSVLDSFAIGEEGLTRSGPVTAFYDSLNGSEIKSYEFDFFGYPVEVEIDEATPQMSRNVIEREAVVMDDYSYSPELFYEAWKRYYRIIYRDSYTRMEPIFTGIKPYIDRKKYDDYLLAELLMFWLQNFDYKRKMESRSDLIGPVETVLTSSGDCDSRALVYSLLLDRFNVDCVLMASEKLKHAIAAVKVKGEGVSYNYYGDDYLGVELTSQNLIGEISDEHKNRDLWTFIELEYSSGL